jgi:DNA-binding beta-propeller fold protein YncE
MKYLSGASSGTVVAGGNGQGTNNTQLWRPYGLAFDSSTNSLVIANYGANNVVRWVLGASHWTLVAGSINGSSGNTSTLLNQPVGVTLDSAGNLYIADSSNHRIQFFLAGQSNGTTIAGITGSSGITPSQLNSPFWVIVDNQMNLYVADYLNNRVQMFLHY